MASAQWKVAGNDQSGQRQYLYLSSPDLKNTREAKKRAADKAKQRWLKKGLKVTVISVECVG